MARVCAYCNNKIDDNESHFSVRDNYLQVKYFESEENNIFCSTECLLSSLHAYEHDPVFNQDYPL